MTESPDIETLVINSELTMLKDRALQSLNAWLTQLFQKPIAFQTPDQTVQCIEHLIEWCRTHRQALKRLQTDQYWYGEYCQDPHLKQEILEETFNIQVPLPVVDTVFAALSELAHGIQCGDHWKATREENFKASTRLEYPDG